MTRIEILGVHRLAVTDARVAEQAAVLHGDLPSHGALRRAREQLEATVLVEALVEVVDASFSADDFVLEDEGRPRSEWQVAYAEAYLSEDGQVVLDRWSRPPVLPPRFRIAFFVHGWDGAKPLRSSVGPLRCPPPSSMPERLSRLVPYEPVD